MITEERRAVDPSQWRSLPRKDLRGRTQPSQPSARSGTPSLLWRLILVLVGFGLAMLGWSLIMTAILSFILRIRPGSRPLAPW